MNYMKPLQEEKLQPSNFKEAMTIVGMNYTGTDAEQAREHINKLFEKYLKDTWFKGVDSKYFPILIKHSKAISFVTFENKFRANMNLLKDVVNES